MIVGYKSIPAKVIAGCTTADSKAELSYKPLAATSY